MSCQAVYIHRILDYIEAHTTWAYMKIVPTKLGRATVPHVWIGLPLTFKLDNATAHILIDTYKIRTRHHVHILIIVYLRCTSESVSELLCTSSLI